MSETEQHLLTKGH